MSDKAQLSRLHIAQKMQGVIEELRTSKPTEPSLHLQIARWAINADTSLSETAQHVVLDVLEGLQKLNLETTPHDWLKNYANERDNCVCFEEDTEVASDTSEGGKNGPPTAIVVDCGTGESKVLLYSTEEGSVKVEELEKLGPASTYIEEGTETINDEFIDKIQKYFHKHRATTAMVGASAWLRNATGDTLRKGNQLLQQLNGSGVQVSLLAPYYEAWLEAVAVDYFAQKEGVSIDCSWASGSGSSQFNDNFKNVHTLQLGNKAGKELILGKDHTKRGVEQWKKEVEAKIKEEAIEFTLNGTILCQSAVYYAGMECGLQPQTHYSYDEVKDAFSNRYNTLINKEGKLDPKEAQGLSNVILQLYILENHIDPSSKFYFVRDTKINGRDFRVTWSCGWYIHFLHTHYEADKSSLVKTNRAISGFSEHMLELDKQSCGTIVAAGSATGVATTLLSLPKAMDKLFRLAEKVEKEATKALKKVEQELQDRRVRLVGMDNCMKSRESLGRKLRDRVEKQLSKYRFLPLYMPRMSDVLDEVDDILRYTIVVDKTECFTDVVKEVKKRLEKDLNSKINMCNFWADGTTYCGINSWVKVPIKDRDFTFELQFHTKESIVCKEDCHQVYEVFRELQTGEAKVLLYDHLKKLWRYSPVPAGLEAYLPGRPMTIPILEQMKQVKLYCDAFRAHHDFPSSPTHDDGKKANANMNVTGLCCRVVVGKNDDFQYLGYGYTTNRRIVRLHGHQVLLKLLEVPTKDIRSVITGMTLHDDEWVTKKLNDGYHFKLIVLPNGYVPTRDDNDGKKVGDPISTAPCTTNNNNEATPTGGGPTKEKKKRERTSPEQDQQPSRKRHKSRDSSQACQQATWENLITMASYEYPVLARTFISKRAELEKTSLKDIERDYLNGQTFRKIKAQGIDDSQYVTLDRLSGTANPKLWQVRGFFFNETGADEHFTGEGTWNYNGTETDAWLIRNGPIQETPGARLLDLLSPEDPCPGYSSEFKRADSTCCNL